MQQEINLYLLLPQEQKSFLTLRLMAISYSIFTMLLFLHLCIEWWGKHKEYIIFNHLHSELNQVQGKLAAIHGQYPMLDLQDIDNSLKKLHQELADKNNIFNLLARDRKFSTYLVGLAKASVPKLWLVDIQAKMADKAVVLKGYATEAEAIQQFVNRLAQQSEFSGLHFQLQEAIQVLVKKETLLQFIISTQVTSENNI